MLCTIIKIIRILITVLSFTTIFVFVFGPKLGSGPSKTTEAKIKLAHIFYIESDYYKNNKEYLLNWNKLNRPFLSKLFSPNVIDINNPKDRYIIGFLNKNQKQVESISVPAHLKSKQDEIIKYARKVCPDCTLQKDRYKAFAAGYFNENSGIDLWAITHEKKLVHITSSLNSNSLVKDHKKKKNTLKITTSYNLLYKTKKIFQFITKHYLVTLAFLYLLIELFTLIRRKKTAINSK